MNQLRILKINQSTLEELILNLKTNHANKRFFTVLSKIKISIEGLSYFLSTISNTEGLNNTYLAGTLPTAY